MIEADGTRSAMACSSPKSTALITLSGNIYLYVNSQRSIDDAKKIFASAMPTGECRRVPDQVLVDAKQVMLNNELARSSAGDKKAKKA